jgi:hypothetical protein
MELHVYNNRTNTKHNYHGRYFPSGSCMCTYADELTHNVEELPLPLLMLLDREDVVVGGVEGGAD